MFNLNWDFVYTIINLLVLYVLLKKFLFRPIMRIMEERETLIQSQLDGAQKTEEQARQLKEKYEVTLAGAQDEADRIVTKGKDRAGEAYDLALKDAHMQTMRMIKETEHALEAERQKAMKELANEVAGLAVAVAEKAVIKQGNGSFDESMMDLFLKEEGTHRG